MTIAEARAHEQKISAQFDEAKAFLDRVEAHAKKNQAQAEIEKINALKARKQEIEKKWHRHLKAAGAAALALKVKDDIQSEVERLKASLEEISTKLRSQANAN